MTLSRRTLLAGAVAAPAALKFAVLPARAAAAGAQVVAVQRLKAGDALVSAISDGFLSIDAGLLTNITPEAAARLLESQFISAPPVTTGINAYLVELGGRRILIDTGGAGFLPSMGRALAGLEALGVGPEAIDAVLQTHLHVDHIGGLLTDGAPTFPKAAIHVHAAEVAFWTDAAQRAAAPDAGKAYFDAAKAVVDAYGDRVRTFSGEAEVVPGIRSRELFGHTPGHTGFLIGSGADPLLIWGDIVHVGPIQMADPEVGVAFDVDPAAAIATRKAILAEVAGSRLRIAGMHIAFPGVGHVVKLPSGDGYDFEPSPWVYALD